MDNIEEAKKLCTEQLLIPFEGYAVRLPNGDCKAYPDPASKLASLNWQDRQRLTPSEYELMGRPWTIGYGSTYDDSGTPVKPGDVWSMDKAKRVKQKILDNFVKELLKASPGLTTENSYKIAGVLSWVYNLGLGNYNKSTFKKMIDNKDWSAAAKECIKWNKAGGKVLKGLTLRRQKEIEFLLK